MRKQRRLLTGGFAPGHTVPKKAKKPKGRHLMSVINDKLDEVKHGRKRVELVADAFVKQAEKGSFVHTKEILDRQEGRVATKIEDGKGKPIKMYIGIPIDGDDAP